MSEPLRLLEPTRISLYLQQANEIALSCAGCLEPEQIALAVAEGLVERFGSAFVRLWLLEPEQPMLRLVASAGLHTHLDGSFARVPLGAYKVGKIAQNRVAFLSNNLPEESWVGNRDWAIEHNVRGFAGYPLVIAERVVGVIAVFNQEAMPLEFLEVLQTLCTMVTIALDGALRQRAERKRSAIGEQQRWSPLATENLALSDRLATILSSTRLTLVGTERSLGAATVFGFLRVAEVLKQLNCVYGRLIYGENVVSLEATVPKIHIPAEDPARWLSQEIGVFGNMQLSESETVMQMLLAVPYLRPGCPFSDREREILGLLTGGDRDRNIADRLSISESTVKFHINNALSKLKARTRYQGIYEAITNGWL